MQSAEVSQWLGELGPSIPGLALIEKEDENFWKLVYENETVLNASFDEQTGRLTLFTFLGAPNEAQKSAVYTYALKYNFLWSQTHAATVAMSGNDELFLLQHIPLAACTAEEVAAAFGKIPTKAALWKRIIENAGTRAEDSAEVMLGVRV